MLAASGSSLQDDRRALHFGGSDICLHVFPAEAHYTSYSIAAFHGGLQHVR